MNEITSSNGSIQHDPDDWKPSTPKEFIATMLHEFRTPMAIIRGYVEILSNEKQKEHHQEAIKAIAASIERMEKLYEDMMAYSRELMEKPDAEKRE